MWTRFFGLVPGVLLFGIVLGASPASAAECDATRPAQLIFRKKADERVIYIDSHVRPQAVWRYDVVIQRCSLMRGLKRARVIGLVEGAGVSVSLDVRGTGRAATLLVDLSRNKLRPGSYTITAVSNDPAVNLYHPLSIKVRDSRVAPWGTVAVLGIVVGVVVLALRATASGEGDRHWSDFVQFFKEPESLVPALVGLAGVYVTVQSRVLSNEAWYGGTADLAKFGGVVITAMVTAGTVATAASRKGATLSETRWTVRSRSGLPG
jgi:hypothetical protein